MAVWTPSSIVTLTTDFGLAGSYVGALRGAVLSAYIGAQLVDITNQIPVQDVREAARVLVLASAAYPAGTVHCVVVDPGVGTDRTPVVVWADGHVFVGPDNGVFGPVADRADEVHLFRITNPDVLAPHISSTFHGRDIFGPVAGAIAGGLAPSLVGPEIIGLVALDEPKSVVLAESTRGEVVAVDHFGNLLSNIRFETVPSGATVCINGVVIDQLVTSYGHLAPGSLAFLASSDGMLEIAVTNGSAADRLAVSRGASVVVSTS
ncbi:MAG: S-adenosylmethionine hydrolase [Myxococcota bacterium]|jgi:S-adenosylmethionine hydrolase